MHSYQSHLTNVLAQAVFTMCLSYYSTVTSCLDDCRVARLILRKQQQRVLFWPLRWPYHSSFCISLLPLLLQLSIIDSAFTVFIIFPTPSVMTHLTNKIWTCFKYWMLVEGVIWTTKPVPFPEQTHSNSFSIF